MSILDEEFRKQLIDTIEAFDFSESVLNCTDEISENSIAISFIGFNELRELQLPEVLLLLVKEIIKSSETYDKDHHLLNTQACQQPQ
jgi:predicted HTH domain antitoxin